MANNCYNFIQINGSSDDIKEFLSMLQINEFQEDGCDIYQNLLTEFNHNEIGENAKWFEMDIHDSDENCILISGDTAWVPSLELFTKISEKFKSFEIRYEYEEAGCDFSGWADIHNGSCKDNCFAYWEGVIKTQGESEALSLVLTNELECYETIEDLLESDMFNQFSKESQKEILENFNE